MTFWLATALALLLLTDIALRVFELLLFRAYRADMERTQQQIYIPPPVIWTLGAGRLLRWPQKEKKRRVI